MTATEAATLNVGDVIVTNCVVDGQRFVVTRVAPARVSDVTGEKFDHAISGRSEKYPKGSTFVFVLDGSKRTDRELSYWTKAAK